MSAQEPEFVSRGGHKLAAALRAFAVSPAGKVCIDLGSHVGGFVDCLLQHGAARVYAVEPGAGVLDARLRGDPRVVACERQNALDFRAPEPAGLITADVGWTPQRLLLPAVRRLLAVDGDLITLVKPQYEAPPDALRRGVVDLERLPEVLALVREDTRDCGWHIAGEIASPLRGHGGNIEFLWWLRPA